MNSRQFKFIASSIGTAMLCSSQAFAFTGILTSGLDCANSGSTPIYYSEGTVYNGSTTTYGFVSCTPSTQPGSVASSITAQVYTFKNGQYCELHVSDYGHGTQYLSNHAYSVASGSNYVATITINGTANYSLITLACNLAPKDSGGYYGIYSFMLTGN